MRVVVELFVAQVSSFCYCIPLCMSPLFISLLLVECCLWTRYIIGLLVFYSRDGNDDDKGRVL